MSRFSELFALHHIFTNKFYTSTQHFCHFFKGAVSRYSVIFCAFFLREEKWRLFTQVSRTSDHDSSVSGANSFTAQTESRKCRFPRVNSRFPRPCLVAAIIFPHTKWLPKITAYRDTVALMDTPYSRLFYPDCRRRCKDRDEGYRQLLH